MTDTTNKPTTWPLVFSYTGTILGSGFLADVQLRGKLLAIPEVNGVWLYGVNPGAIAVGATTLAVANSELRDTLTRLFIDFAAETASFDAFKESINSYFFETDDESVRSWNDALECIRAGSMPVPDGLPRQLAESYVKVTQKTLDEVTPQDNLLVQQEATDQYLAAAA